jgi:DNA repair protein RadC
MNVRLSAKEKNKKYDNSESIAKILQDVLLRENQLRRVQEHFWIVGLNPKLNIVVLELVALGAHNRVVIPPIDVFRLVVTKNATQAVLVHNHPSGRMKPSKEDRSVTNRLLKAGEMLGVNVLDHLIINEEDYFSFLDSGIMAELHASEAWRLVSEESAEVKELQLEMREAQGALNAKNCYRKKT